MDRLMDRVRSEAAQKVELQEGLFEARALYASVVADRESMEARTARAEAERSAADNHYARAKEQVRQSSGHKHFPVWHVDNGKLITAVPRHCNVMVIL